MPQNILGAQMQSLKGYFNCFDDKLMNIYSTNFNS